MVKIRDAVQAIYPYPHPETDAEHRANIAAAEQARTWAARSRYFFIREMVERERLRLHEVNRSPRLAIGNIAERTGVSDPVIRSVIAKGDEKWGAEFDASVRYEPTREDQ